MENFNPNQTAEWGPESHRYVSTYLRDGTATLRDLEFLKDEKIESCLDVGCGGGENLRALVEMFGCRGTGVEPSREAVSLLKKKFSGNGNLSFVSASSHQLPLPSDSFDLVICWSVLHWVGRNEYLQSLGELVRVCGKFLVVMDFVSAPKTTACRTTARRGFSLSRWTSTRC